MALTGLHIEALLEHCLNGNHLAQMEVYKRYYKAMYTTSLRILKDSAEAEDAMQEAFLTAFSKLHTLQNKSDFGTWLKRIVVNQSISVYRKRVQHLDIDEKPVYALSQEALEDNQEDYSAIKAQQVVDAIESMKDNYRNILNLHYIEGYDHEEIAEIMRLSYANSRTLLSRAKTHLKQLLSNNNGYGKRI